MEINDLKAKITEYKKKNIVLIGHMGSGKTLIARKLSKLNNINHLDSDKIIEDFTEKSIKSIFEINGEAYFRNIEEKIVLDILNKNDTIISLGGGSILSSKVRKLLKNNSITIFLDVDTKTLQLRLKNSKKRPLINQFNIEEKIKDLDKQRRKYYLLADITIKNHKNTNETIQELIKKLLLN